MNKINKADRLGCGHFENEPFVLSYHALRMNTHYTPSEFHAKYGSRSYPFDLVGDAIQHDGKWWKRVSSEKSFLVEVGVSCLVRDVDAIKNAHIEVLLGCLHSRKSMLKFATYDSHWACAWVEVDAPEPESITLAEAEKRLGMRIKVEFVK